MEAAEADAFGNCRAGREGQHDSHPHQRQEGRQEPAIDRPPPVGRRDSCQPGSPSVCPSDRMYAPDRVHGIAKGVAAHLEILELVETRTSLRQQHHRLAASVPRRICSRVFHRRVQSAGIFIRDRFTKRRRKSRCSLADQISLAIREKEATQWFDATLLGQPAGDPIDRPKLDSAGAAASALVAFESLINST